MAMGPPGAPLPMADAHNDLLLGVLHQRERGHPDPFGAFWLPQLRAGGVVLQVLPIYTEAQHVGEGALRRAILVLETARWIADVHRDDVAIVETARQLREVVASGRIALVLAFEGLEPMGGDVAVLQIKDLSPAGELNLASALRINSGSGPYERHYLAVGDVLLQSRGSQHPAAVFSGAIVAIAALGLHIIRPRSDVVRPDFLLWFLNQSRTQARLRDGARESTVPFLAKADVEDFSVPLPTLEVQERVIAVERLRRREQDLADQLDRLRRAYIDTLMWRAAVSDRPNRG